MGKMSAYLGTQMSRKSVLIHSTKKALFYFNIDTP